MRKTWIGPSKQQVEVESEILFGTVDLVDIKNGTDYVNLGRVVAIVQWLYLSAINTE